MNKDDLLGMLGRPAHRDRDTIAQAVERAAEHGDMDELRRLAAGGSQDAVDQLVELAQERDDLPELRRLAAGGNQDAADILSELAEEADETNEADETDCAGPTRSVVGPAPGRSS